MKITSFEFAYIKAFKSLKFDIEKTSVLIGQNDHGKSSILKAIDIVLNQLDNETLAHGFLHPDLAERLLPLFHVNAKARRITINYNEKETKGKQLHITVKSDLTFTILEDIKRGAKTSKESLIVLENLRKHNKFVLIPALRDASSKEFQELLTRMLRRHGLTNMIPQRAGGTPKEYRELKAIRNSISKEIKPYIDKALLPKIKAYFGFDTQHELALKFGVNVQDIGEWILQNLHLGFQLTSDTGTTLALSEAGSGVQSAALLALRRLEQEAMQNPNTQFILAVEEPEAFLHPQKQKELYKDILAAQSGNLRIIVTTHSPYIVAETPFTRLGLLKKDGKYSALHVAAIRDKREQEMFDAYSNEVNSQLFFADKVVLVEGESDMRVIKLLLEKKFGPKACRISIVSASGNANFSPFLRMIKAWGAAKIPHLVVTDFDSLMKSTERAILVGAKDAGYKLTNEQSFHAKVDDVLDKSDEKAFSVIASDARGLFSPAGLNVFVFTSDLENSLITADNKDAVAKILTEETNNRTDYKKGYSLEDMKRLIGSKGIPPQKNDAADFKKPFIHRKIAETIDLGKAHQDIERLLDAIGSL
jgi:predicted ATP-dependent endonuclease of OLD family